MNDYTREKIKLRMLKRIALLWDISDIEHIDPVIKLLIEALAEEIFRLSGELSELDDRLLSKLAASMTPVSHLTARPAHGIVSAMPVESTVTVDRNTSLECKDPKAQRKYNLTNIRFTPIVPFQLVKAKIRLIQVEDKLYSYDQESRKNILFYTQHRDEGLNNTAWVGIDLSAEITHFDNLSLYFDFMNVEDKHKYLRLLSYLEVSIAGEKTAFQTGLKKEAEKETGKQDYLKKQTDIIFSDLQALYDTHYITLEKATTAIRENYPAAWATYYPEEVLNRLDTPLLWIRISFPPAIPSEILEYLRIGINLFPVANISKRTVSQPMTDVSLFMPLETIKNEFFVEIESVKDSSGKLYELLSSDNYVDKNKATGTYSLRRGGVEQYSNTNDVKSTVIRLADIIRDRTMLSNSKAQASFNQLINDILVATDKITNITETLPDTCEIKSYIIVDRSNPGETLMADYWITNGKKINNFKSSDPLSISASYAGAIETDIHFVTPVLGGTAVPSLGKIQDMHRYMLTTHDKLFTTPDIFNFCQAEYGNYIDHIEIKAGAAIGTKPYQGLIKTIDLHITMKKGLDTEIKKENFHSELLCKLENRSPESFNYRIFINQ
ncbi:MAG: type VI secretion system baseplate subunit TssF [Parabacteroides sp.]|nr:type VI secretion system baseplate subunit TssF [Parabacteroides sp.]